MPEFKCPNPDGRIAYEAYPNNAIRIAWENTLSPEMKEFYNSHCLNFRKVVGQCSLGAKTEYCQLLTEYELSCIACNKKFNKQYSR